MGTLVQILIGHMRFVPTHKQTKGDANNLTPAKWPGELVLISNEEGNSTITKHRSRSRYPRPHH